ncbi:MAG: phospholipid carrier-dependent glycosyltransferase [Armatimonadetes bacterium]|nr:phospholipid carrier-dependent glycosyltransferase [Armatimonadota bacterium]
MARLKPFLPALLILAASFALRAVALDTDAYGRLDWSAGLLTDEGFYTHNARNMALFGAARTDEFNNMLLSPSLHALQAWLMTSFGVGAVQVRWISVLAGTVGVGLLGAILWRTVSPLAALGAMAVLGLDHTSALFSRMALMDTPAGLGCTAGLACFAVALLARRDRAAWAWMALCGAILGATVMNRSLTLYILPAPVLALLHVAYGMGVRRRPVWVVTRLAAYGAALVLVVGGFWLECIRPNAAEIGPMTRYYRTRQLQPKSSRQLAGNLQRAAFGDHRGIAPYLFRHAPVPFVLTLVGLAAAGAGRLRRNAAPSVGADAALARQGVVAFLAAWLACGWLLLAAVAYSPTRYYISTYPALAGLAGWALSALVPNVRRLAARLPEARLAAAAVAAFVAYHAVQTLLHRGGPGTRGVVMAALCLLPAAAALCWVRWGRPVDLSRRAVPVMVAVCAVWVMTNGWWLADWARSQSRSQIEMSRWLGRELPRGSVLIGDVAPGVCMDNRHVAVNVINGLCNGDSPVERWAGRPRYVVILDGRWLEQYWTERYPELIIPANRVKLARVLRWDVGVYRVPADYAGRAHRVTIGRNSPEGKTG